MRRKKEVSAFMARAGRKRRVPGARSIKVGFKSAKRKNRRNSR